MSLFRRLSGSGRAVVFGVVLVCLCSGAFGQPWDGNGVEGDPYQIWTAEDMQAIGADSNYWDAHFVLCADINLSAYTGTQFNIIGSIYSGSFTGVFDGNSHTIANFTYDSNGVNCVGLFGLAAFGQIMNLGLREPNVNAGTGGYVGSLVGFLDVYGIVSNCYAEGGRIRGSRSCIGGLVGYSGSSISGCYSTGEVSGGDVVGGLVGYNSGGTVTYSYSTGNVTGGSNVGGLIGATFDNGQAYDSFWDVETSGQENSAGGTGKTTTQMQVAWTFIGWGCEPVWRIDEGNDYPHLIWENTPGVVITSPSYGGGDGEPNNPYLIYTAEQLNTIGLVDCQMGKHYRLMADIDLDGFGESGFNIIGSKTRPFTGFFDGNGYEIHNFEYTSTDVNFVGLFGHVSGSSGIIDLGVIDANVQAGTGDFVGLLVGYLGGSSGVSRCYVRGGNVAGETYVGGLVGYDSYGTISNCDIEANVSGSLKVGGLAGLKNGSGISTCHFVGSIEADEDVGGLAGYGTHTNIIECYVDGIISGTTTVGGLVGRSHWCYIKDCYNMSVVEGVDNIGGLAGYAVFENSVLENCYSVGNVSGDVNCGGLVGRSSIAIVSDCYWDVEATGQLSSAGGGIGKATIEMQDVGTYIGWGCESRWTIDDGNDYPRLAWQNEPGISIGGGAPWDGSGTESEPYRIYTAEQFDSIGLFECEWDKNFKLMVDVDIGRYTGAQFNVIGHPRNKFDGRFDGNSRRVLNFTYEVPGGGYTGIFGGLGNDTEIRDITLVNPDTNTDGHYNGALIGKIWGDNTIVRNCHVINGVVSGGSYTGGLVGEVTYGQNVLISQCSTACDVYGWSNVGGLAGKFTNGTISECAATGNVTGVDIKIGGLLGRASNPATIENSYARGDVAGSKDVAGLIGDVWDYWHPVIINKCYSTGKVQGGSSVGGLVTDMYYPSNVTYSFWDVWASGTSYSGGGTGKTTTKMQMESTFTDAGWDFNTPIWTICEGRDYPRLEWQVDLMVDIDIDELWMYQSLPGQTGSTLTVSALSIGDPSCNSSYSYEWEIVLPGDVNLAPVTVDGGGASDAYWTFAARGCDEPGGLSDSGQTFTVRVTVTGDDYGNTGAAEAEFGIALLGDVNNDGIVNIVDRSIANVFWRLGSAGPYTLRDCDVTSDGIVNVVDRSIVNAVWRGMTGQNSVSSPCPLR